MVKILEQKIGQFSAALALSGIALVVLGIPRAALASEYDIHIQATNQSCTAEAAALASRFAQSTGVSPSQAVCVGQVTFAPENTSVNLYHLRLTYSPQGVPQEYSAIFGMSPGENQIGTTRGAYSSFVACSNDTQNQAVLFKKATGLLPVASYCEPGRDSLIQHSYVLHVDGFGQPENKLQVFNAPSEIGPTVMNQAFSILASTGATLALITPHTEFFYVPSAVPLHYDILEVFSDSNTCSKQLSEANGLMSGMGVQSSYVACIQQGASYAMQSLRVGDVYVSHDTSVSTQHFYSLDECLADKDHIKSTAFSKSWRYQAVFCQEDYNANSGYVPEILGLY